MNNKSKTSLSSLSLGERARERAYLIKTEAKRLGFLSCGISKAQFLEVEAPRLEK